MNDAPIAQSAVVMLTQEELGALCALMISSDPWPEGVDRVKVETALDRFAMQMGAGSGWIEACHRIPTPGVVKPG